MLCVSFAAKPWPLWSLESFFLNFVYLLLRGKTVGLTPRTSHPVLSLSSREENIIHKNGTLCYWVTRKSEQPQTHSQQTESKKDRDRRRSEGQPEQIVRRVRSQPWRSSAKERTGKDDQDFIGQILQKEKSFQSGIPTGVPLALDGVSRYQRGWSHQSRVILQLLQT